jgi:hypothetical protein
MRIKLKKSISFPMCNLEKGTVQETEWFSHMLRLDVQNLDPEIKNEWFEPHILDMTKEGHNDFRIKLHAETDLYDELYSAIYLITHKTVIHERNTGTDQQ